jgi:hypothetical protein
MIESYTVSAKAQNPVTILMSKDHALTPGEVIVRTYRCGSPKVAAKKFLNYCRRFKPEARPTELTITWGQASIPAGLSYEAKAVAEWYEGPFDGDGLAHNTTLQQQKLLGKVRSGVEGLWWRLVSVEVKSLKSP